MPYPDLLALKSIGIVARYLPKVMDDGSNLEAREAMARADTRAGLCIADAGVTLPHGISKTVGGYWPQVMHGEALAAVCPEFTRYTYVHAVKQSATMGRILDPVLADESADVAAAKSCEVLDGFLKRVGMWLSLEDLGMSQDEVELIADHSQVLPDYRNNPRVATRDDINDMLIKNHRR